MKITLNGELLALNDSINITQLLSKFGFSGQIAVEINQNIIPRSTFSIYKIEPDDNVEIVEIIGGG